MKRLTRIVVLALVLVMLVSVFAACDDKKGGGLATTTTTTPQNPGGPDTQVSAWETDDQGFYKQLVPETLKFADDTEAKLLIYQQRKTWHFPDAMVEGENIRNDIFERNDEIAQKRNLVFDVTFKSSHMSSGDDGYDLYNEALEGSTNYDAICCYSLYPAMMALEGILEDINGLEYPSTEMPWFPVDIQEYSIMDRLFFVANTSSLTNLLAVWVTYANRVMIENKGLENIEDVVLDGRWTLDVMKTYSRNWASEAEQNPGSAYGVFFVHPRTTVHPFYYGAGFTATRRDAAGQPEYAFMSETDRELIDNFMDDFIDMMNSPECGFGAYNGSTVQPLKDETAVFFIASIDFYSNLQSEFTYCFIPMPKATEEQERYLSCRHDNWDVWSIPTYSEDKEIGGVLIDDFSYSDYRYIAPKFWDNDFKYRYSDSDKGVKMFDIIRNSVVTDFGRVHRMNIGSPFSGISNCIWDVKENPPTMANIWIDYLEKKEADYNSRLLDLKILIAQMGQEEEES